MMRTILTSSLLLSSFLSPQKNMAQPETSKQLRYSDMTYNVRIAGPEHGVPVILLHGWPETSHMWLSLMDTLATQGYRCVAPDQRGFSPLARPSDVNAYSIDHLAHDVVALADAMGFERFHLIGHDWGAAIGWAVVARNPERIRSWTAMSVPHIQAFAHAIRNDPQQRRMSRYMSWFQWRGLAEWFLLRSDAKVLRGTWRKSNPDQVNEYLRVLGTKEAIRASLNYYRANYRMLKRGDEVHQFADINVPTLMLWGKRDFALGRTGIEATATFIKGPYRLVELDATHWLMQEAGTECATEILKHIRSF